MTPNLNSAFKPGQKQAIHPETAKSLLLAADSLEAYARLPRSKKYRASIEQAAADYRRQAEEAA